MGYYVSNMIGIRISGVFAGKLSDEGMRQLKDVIAGVVKKMREDDDEREPDLGDENGDPSHCMSGELEAHKGSYVVLAGVFNYWRYPYASVFVQRLSLALEGHEVMHMCWDHESDEVQCQVWLNGKPLFEQVEDPIGRVLRHVM